MVLFRKISKIFKASANRSEPSSASHIIPRPQHNISRENISENALKVLYRLHKAGYQACLVGGAVRDLALGLEPKDFDVATDASPEDVKSLFRNCRLIGRRFRLAHVFYGRDIIEVATFRGSGDMDVSADQLSHSDEGRILRDNVYGSIEEDARRRDFTVNAMYYDIRDFSVLDYMDGMKDIEQGILRIIGEPEQRYREDPVRMLRVVRFAVKLGFKIHLETETPIFDLAGLLDDISPSRLFDESVKLFMSGQALQTFELLRHYGLFAYLYPMTEEALSIEDHDFPIILVSQAMKNTDERLQSGKSVTPAFIYASILWEPVRLLAERINEEEDLPAFPAMQKAIAKTLQKQSQHTAIPKRFSIFMREVWQLQGRFEFTTGMRPYKLLSHPRFRAAYDFLLLRAGCGEVSQELADWWTHFQDATSSEKKKMTRPGKRPGKKKK
ncbi:MAG: polynucleotide adenylyltransferase PcnB [Gammaproteobacteria bacterium]|nr:polynucleotide adenylyltransferase PcnB [Gammaproteobacteria bacterium]